MQDDVFPFLNMLKGKDSAIRKTVGKVLCNHENLDLDAQDPCQKSSEMVHTCNPRVGRQSQDNPQSLQATQSSQLVSSMLNKRPYLKN